VDFETIHTAYKRKDVDTLVRALSDSDLAGQRTAARLVGKLGAEEAVPALIACLDIDDRTLKMLTLLSLGRIGDRRAILRVAELAENDPNLAVSTRATNILAQFGDPRAVGQLTSLLTETDRHLEGGRANTYLPDDGPFTRRLGRPSKVKWWIQKWAARRLVELQASDAASAVEQAARAAGSRRERRLLRRTSRRLRGMAA
jgi:HEAT repeat protein